MVKNIRQAVVADLDRIMEIFEIAKVFMKQTGNPHQWINGYPQREYIMSEITSGHCRVCLSEEEKVIGKHSNKYTL